MKLPTFLRERPRILVLTTAAALLLVAVVALGAGWWLRGLMGAERAPVAETPATPTTWTCSMHPSIQQSEPGDCPICGMDLIPLDGVDDALGPRQLVLGEHARALARVEVAPVERRWVNRRLRLVGKVTFDETRLSTITARVGGRLDRLYVDYTGVRVEQGDHMVWLYSPEILAAQEELLQARQALDADVPALREGAEATLTAVRDKLRLWGLADEQIAAIEARGTASDHIQLNAPVGGIVIARAADEGSYVQVGTPIFRIADLSQVWVKLEAYERDLPWLHYGQEVTFTTPAAPGQQFTGRISFIDPVLTETTRTVKVRVNAPNADGRLKPGMFVQATVNSRVSSGGRVVAPDLAGKWISPMHPEIVKDGPGSCDVCGMDLVPAAELGLAGSDPATAEPPLVIPDSAPLITGTRAVVYVQDRQDPALFTGREVVLGPWAGHSYIVESGLREGEKVVVQGNFKIDSALQIQARPSMMSMEGSTADRNMHAAQLTVGDDGHGAHDGHEGHGAHDGDHGDQPPAKPVPAAQLAPLFRQYFAVQKALADDDPAAARKAAKALAEAVPEKLPKLREAAGAVAKADQLAAARAAFEPLSEALIAIGQAQGTGLEQEIFVILCPMAFDNQGARWLFPTDDVQNPYYGEAMYGCGAPVARIPAKPTKDAP